MLMLRDGSEFLRTVDRALQENFDGILLVNRGGDYTFSKIAVFGPADSP